MGLPAYLRILTDPEHIFYFSHNCPSMNLAMRYWCISKVLNINIISAENFKDTSRIKS